MKNIIGNVLILLFFASLAVWSWSFELRETMDNVVLIVLAVGAAWFTFFDDARPKR